MTQGILSKLYSSIIAAVDKVVPNKLRPLWMSPTGPKTVFFWAPVFKSGLVIAGIGDLKRPPEQVSLNQTTTVAITGLIWSRYSMVIRPKNYMLLGVNSVVFLTQAIQALGALKYRMSLERKGN